MCKMVKTEKAAGAKDTTAPIEQLQLELKIPTAIHAGACTQMGWRCGKEIEKKEYIAAIEKFKGKAAGRSKNA